jgi:hypothetical protein
MCVPASSPGGGWGGGASVGWYEAEAVWPTRRDERGVTDIQLSNADFVDTDGDGILEIVNPSRVGPPAAAWEVYRLAEPTYVASTSLDYLGDYYPLAIPGAATDSFAVASPGPGFMLTVINGDRDGGNGVGAGTIWLNGLAVVTPSIWMKACAR